MEYKIGEFHKKKRGERFMWLSSAIMLIWNAKKLGLDKYMTEAEGKEILKKELKELCLKTKSKKWKLLGVFFKIEKNWKLMIIV